MLRNLCTILVKVPSIQTACNANALLHTSTALRAACTEVTQRDGVREITLNMPEKRNPLSMAMMESLQADLLHDMDNEELRCIVLSAKGPVWSAGHNIKELAGDGGAALQTEVFAKLSDIITSIYQAPVPVIAKVNGVAAAAGCQLVASCDIVVATDKASFSTPGANFGIFCSTPGIAIARVMPRLKSAYMVLTGLPLSAEQAYIAGLASVVVPAAELDAEMLKITQSICSKSRAVLALGKQFYYKQLNMNLQEAYQAGTEIMTQNLALPDGKEGIDSFVNKRKPKWTHK